MTATAFTGSISFPLPRISSVAQEEHRSAGSGATPTCGAESTSSSVHAGADARQPSSAGASWTGDAVDERGDHAGLADRAGSTVEQVAIEDDEVGRLPDLDRADLLLEVVDPGGPGRERREGVDQVQRVQRGGTAVARLGGSRRPG